MKIITFLFSSLKLRQAICMLILIFSFNMYSQILPGYTVINSNKGLVDKNHTKNEALTYNASFIYSQRINASTDDAREDLGKGGSMKLTEADVKFGKLNANEEAGLRFTSLNIPDNATITSAFMYWDNGEANNPKIGSVQIYAENSGTPTTFSSAFPNISNRTKTTNSVQHDISWAGGVTNQQTPDLKTIVQEVVDTNNGLTDIVFILVENASSNDELKIISYDDVTAQAAKLEVNYEDGLLSVNKETFLPVNAFPNPATNVIFLEFDVRIDNFRITLLSSRGQIVKEISDTNKKRVELNLSDLSSGLYFAKIETNNKIGIIKIVKQ